MNTFIFDGSWNQIKGKLRQKFGQLTDADLEFVEGKGEELLGRLQAKLGLHQAELETMLNEIKSSLPPVTNAARDAVQQVKARASEMANDFKGMAGSLAQDVTGMAADKVAEFEDFAGATYDQAREKVRTLKESGEERIRKNPMETVLAALAAGFVMGLMMRRI